MVLGWIHFLGGPKRGPFALRERCSMVEPVKQRQLVVSS